MFEKPGRTIERVFLHCSASDDENLVGVHMVDEIRRWHRDRGWSDVGYHFLIDKLGGLFPGRDPDLTPAAQKGHNAATLAIMVHGLTDFSNTSLTALQTLCGDINEAYHGRISFHGHKEVTNKDCPVFDYKNILVLDRWGRMP